jgi:hypothetical protein
VLNIVDDDPAPASEWLPYLATCAGAKRPMRVPVWLAGEVAVVMMTEGRGFSNAKAKRERTSALSRVAGARNTPRAEPAVPESRTSDDVASRPAGCTSDTEWYGRSSSWRS